ncbi:MULTISPECIES: hypothetical protein [unclassified Pseudomonas]|uniref:hypothetical protein n=1 Tax=unclassified Pseudomonas TaxID=196821 RepID=UPI0015A3E629|nr:MULTISPECIES: hypothetical protein [unclassified Pseudomonas]NWC95733.1 hypothetical protein [Pseudomonas sp. IPO3779]NWD15351.1 hypothetical protein [Pseudomonas sp. IPO3778]
MSQLEPPQSNAFRHFVIGVLCVAVVLGAYFVRLNAQVDRQREEAAERLALCRQAASVSRTTPQDELVLVDPCRHLSEHYLKKPRHF